MRDLNREFGRLVIISIIVYVGAVLLSAIVLIIIGATMGNFIFFGPVLRAIFSCLLTAWLIFVTTIYIIFSIRLKKDMEKELKETDQILTSKFSPVYLKSSGKISEKVFICQAKVCENGRIICKITTDFEVSFDNNEAFLQYFDVKKR